MNKGDEEEPSWADVNWTSDEIIFVCKKLDASSGGTFTIPQYLKELIIEHFNERRAVPIRQLSDPEFTLVDEEGEETPTMRTKRPATTNTSLDAKRAKRTHNTNGWTCAMCRHSNTAQATQCAFRPPAATSACPGRPT
jgi:glutamine synthetase